jgi:hypothetical protein
MNMKHLKIEWRHVKRKRRSRFKPIIANYALYTYLEAHTWMCSKRACIHDFSTTHQNSQPSLILKLGKIVHVLRLSNTCTKWVNQYIFMHVLVHYGMHSSEEEKETTYIPAYQIRILSHTCTLTNLMFKKRLTTCFQDLYMLRNIRTSFDNYDLYSHLLIKACN